MALISKPDYTYIWASGGSSVEPSDTKKQTGWTAEVPPFQWENWIQNRQDQMLAHINQRGIPQWDGQTEYEAGGLSYVQGSNGVVYKSVAASGPSTTTQDPTTDVSDTYWTVAFADVGAFLTQASGDARYLQKTNNLSDLSNASVARTNLGVQNAVEAGIQGSSSNLKLSATGLSALVTITADSVCVKNTSNFQVVLNNVNVSPSLAASGANGLDTGVSAASTLYYIWVIWDGTTTAGLFSLSSTSPTMPAGYTHKALVGAQFADATVNKYPLSFKQDGNLVRYKVATGSNVPNFPIAASGLAGNVLTPTYVSVSMAAFVPPNARAAIVTYNVLSSDANVTAMISANNNTGIINSPTNPPDYNFTNTTTGGSSSFPIRIHLETLALFWANNNGNGRLRVHGWEF